VKPDKPELKIREYELFRSYYCGLCKSIGKRYGLLHRVTLTYDCTFLALLLNSVFSNSVQLRDGFCLLHPSRKRKIVRNNKFINYAADCNILLAYNKLRDNMMDEEKVLDKAACVLLSRSYKKARSRYPGLAVFIEEKLQELRRLEEEKCDNLDRISEPFARLTEKLFCNEELMEMCGVIDYGTMKVLEWLGYNLGKWIYIADACHDLKEDFVEGRFNPILSSRPMKDKESIDEYKKRISGDISFILDYCLAEAAKAMDLLELRHSTGIIDNIVYSGMRKISMEVIK